MKKKSLLDDNGEPRFCLCQKRWYKVLFDKNPLLINKYYWLGFLDPESYLEWWHLGAPVRLYYWKRDKWIDIISGNQRTKKLYGEPIPIERLKRTTDGDDAGGST